MNKNNICDSRSPKGQRDYQDTELRLIRFAYDNDISANDVAKILMRDVSSVVKKSRMQGYLLREVKNA